MQTDAVPGAAAHAPTADLSFCLGCGYDLAGLPHDTHCPECGYPIAESVAFGLASQPIPLLSRLRSGPIWIFSGLGAQLVAGVANSAFSSFAMVAFAQNSTWLAVAIVLAGAVCALGAQVALFIGYWRYATPLEGAPPPGWKDGHRRTLRATSVAALGLTVVTAPSSFLVLLLTAPSPGAPPGAAPAGWMFVVAMAGVGLGFIGGLVELVRYLSTAGHTAALAKRIPDPKLARLAKHMYRWTAGVIIASVVLAGAMILAAAVQTGGAPFGSGVAFFAPMLGLVLVAFIAFGLWIGWIVMLAKALAAVSRVRRAAILRTRGAA